MLFLLVNCILGVGPAWTSDETQTRVRVSPVRDLRSLQLLFPCRLASTERVKATSTNPEVLVSHLLGHEGRDTLHSLLRTRAGRFIDVWRGGGQ